MAVQISGNDITVPRDTTVTRNLTVGGVLTYEDVTNVDSVGLVTARSGIEIGASPGVGASISVDGNAIFSGITTVGTGLSMGDNVRANFGDSGDLQIYHNGAVDFVESTSTYLILEAPNTIIRNLAGDEDYAKFFGNAAVELYYNGTKKIETTSTGASITGVLDLSSHLDMGDSDAIKLGDGDDLQIYHSGSLNLIDVYTNNLQIRNGTSEKMAAFNLNGSVELYYDNSKKLETTSSGVAVTGELDIADSEYLDFGNGGLKIRTNSNNAYITEATSGKLAIQGSNIEIGSSDGGETYIYCTDDGSVSLYYDNALQFSTTSDGLILNSGARISRTGNSNNTIMEVTNAQYAKSIYFGGWDAGSNDAGIARVRNSNDNLHIDAGSAGIIYMNAYCTGATFIRDLWPLSNDTYDLGRNSEKWDDVYATNGTIQTSDKNQKNTIIDSDLGLSFVNKLKPVSYKFNSGTRTHYGLIAQDIETVLSDISKSTTDFAGFIKTDLPDEYYQEAEPHIPEGKKEGDLKSAAHTEYGLRYGEFISPLIKAVQELSAENTALKARLDAAGL